MDLKPAIRILSASLSDREAAIQLQQAGYCYAVFGHDSISNGLYVNNCQEGDWNHGRGETIAQLDRYDLIEGDFWYAESISETDIPTLREFYL